LKKLLDLKPFKKGLSEKPNNDIIGVINCLNGCGTNLLKKLDRKFLADVVKRGGACDYKFYE